MLCNILSCIPRQPMEMLEIKGYFVSNLSLAPLKLSKFKVILTAYLEAYGGLALDLQGIRNALVASA